jgi:hypothetical protein
MRQPKELPEALTKPIGPAVPSPNGGIMWPVKGTGILGEWVKQPDGSLQWIEKR